MYSSRSSHRFYPLREKEKRIYQAISEGEYNVIVGTHALIQEKVEYRDLSLVVTDEQHRFGVRSGNAWRTRGREPMCW